MKTITAAALTLAALCFAVTALADMPPATQVYIDGVLLDGQALYLASGSDAAVQTKPADGGYAHFDSATATLTLHGMTLHTAANVPGVPQSLIYADGSLTVALEGDNTLRYTTNAGAALLGIAAKGALTLAGSGTLTVSMNSFNEAAGNTVTAVSAGESLLVQGGNVAVAITSGQTGFGLHAAEGIAVSGGDVQVTVQAKLAHAVYAGSGDVTITGGNLMAEAKAAGEADVATGLNAAQITLAGGQATFQATGAPEHSLGASIGGTITVTGGRLRLIGETRAVNEEMTAAPITDTLIPVYCAEAASGAGMQPWTDGLMPETDDEAVSVRFLQFGDYPTAETAPVEAAPAADAPKERSAGFWVGVGLLSLIVGVMLGGYTRKKR
ncbi:MAG TPA: hypothetical protein PKU80_08445 [Candidatus Limiplasma sp.]|nr:hypothetical protein [Candidatus Limiplasma sp.]HRX08643.1 hypothetical protein [Candidatus Limiplasma sp.]